MRAQAGDMQAREELVRDNLALVHYVLRRFKDRRREYEDLFQYGCMGLVKAIDRFDPAYGVRFSTYAVPLIMGEVRRYLRDDGAVHVSRTIHDHAACVDRWREAYVQQHGREPTICEISDGMQLSKEDVLLALNSRREVRSLSEPVGSEGGMRLMDTLGEDVMDRVDSRLVLSRLLRQLTPEERKLILRRYFAHSTQSEIAGEMGMTQVQVSRMEKRILKRMRVSAGVE